MAAFITNLPNTAPTPEKTPVNKLFSNFPSGSNNKFSRTPLSANRILIAKMHLRARDPNRFSLFVAKTTSRISGVTERYAKARQAVFIKQSAAMAM